MITSPGFGRGCKKGDDDMYITNMVRNPDLLQRWTKGWIDSCRDGTHTGVGQIHALAAKIEERYCTNGAWNPDGLAAYDALRQAADEAQAEYERAMPGME